MLSVASLRRLAAVIASGLALACATGPVMAQPEESPNGMTCVQQRLMAGRAYEVVAEVFLYDDIPEVQIGRAASILELAAQACAAEHQWNGSRQASASDIGLYRATIAFLAEKMVAGGATAETKDAFLEVVAGMQPDDFAAFNELDWRSDLAFTRRLTAMALDAGVPDTDEMIDLALDILELGARAAQSVHLFRLDLAESA
jgi:hypothetical protein